MVGMRAARQPVGLMPRRCVCTDHDAVEPVLPSGDSSAGDAISRNGSVISLPPGTPAIIRGVAGAVVRLHHDTVGAATCLGREEACRLDSAPELIAHDVRPAVSLER